MELRDENFSTVTIREARNASDFWSYLKIILVEREWTWPFWILELFIFGRNRFKHYVIEKDGKIIGGFGISEFPAVKYKPFNWLNPRVRKCIDTLHDSGYEEFCEFIISSDYRNSGIGSFVFKRLFQEMRPDLKVYFTATKKAVPFYLRHGVVMFCPSRYSIYKYDGADRRKKTDSHASS